MTTALSDDELAQHQTSAEQRLAQLQAEYTTLGNAILAESLKLGALLDEASRRRHAKAVAEGRGLDWSVLLEEGLGAENTKAANQVLASLGLMGSGYFPETNQRAVRIALKRADAGSVDTVHAGLLVVMPHLKPLKDGWCYVGILEATLSARTSFKLRFLPDGSEFQCVHYRYDRVVIERASADLVDVLRYIAERHPDA